MGPRRPTSARRSSEADRDDEGFTIYLSINEMPSVDLYRRFADAGVFDFVCAPWMCVAVARHAGRQALTARLDAVHRFADDIVAKF